ncbi:MAG: esterase/lipase family protein [Sporichthyaceae bacterium]
MRTPTSLAALLAVATILTIPGAAHAGSGPMLRVDARDASAALDCPDGVDGPRDPILLVHGIAQTAAEAWSANYLPLLKARGEKVCLVDLPAHATGDVQAAAEYVVSAVRAIAAKRAGSIPNRSGSSLVPRSSRSLSVDVVTFSKGALELRWALRWWPDVRAAVDDAVLLGAPNLGSTAADLACGPGCVPAAWQVRPDSAFLAALNEGDPTPGAVSYTVVYSGTDELAFRLGAGDPWAASSELAGAANLRVQDYCPGRVVEHAQLTYDAVAYAVALDALTHPGPAQRDRVAVDCTKVFADGIDPLAAQAGLGGFGAAFFTRAAFGMATPAEPRTADYATN